MKCTIFGFKAGTVRKMKPRVLYFVALVLSVGYLLILAGKSSPQDLGSLGKQAEGLGAAAKVAEKLHLSPHQLQQVLPILGKEVPKLRAITGNMGISNTQKESQIKAVQHQSDSKLKTILSPEQFLSLKNIRVQQLQDLLHAGMPH